MSLLKRLWWPAVMSLALIWAVIARWVGAHTDFSFDEVWSLQMALRLQSPLQAFTVLHHDNNHYLNTIWLHLLGYRTDCSLYRLPSALAGLGCVVLLTRIAGRRGAAERVTALVLSATSYLFVLYSTEARGYGMAMFFSLACLDVMDQFLREPRAWHPWAFSAAALLGVLSHLTFLFPYLGIAAWHLHETWHRKHSVPLLLGEVLRFHATPALLVGLLYAIDLRQLSFGGGPHDSVFGVIAATITYIAGLRPETTWPVALALATLAVGAAVCIGLARRGDSRWTLYTAGILLAPAFIIIVTHPPHFTGRYFLLCVPLLMLLLADGVALVHRTRASVLAWMALAVVAGSNLQLCVRASRHGRGHYRQAFTDIVRESNGPTTVGSDSDAHALMLLSYYQQQTPFPERLQYLTGDHWPAEGPDWVLLETYDTVLHPSRQVEFSGKGPYRLAHVYPYSARLTGHGWLLYRRVR